MPLPRLRFSPNRLFLNGFNTIRTVSAIYCCNAPRSAYAALHQAEFAWVPPPTQSQDPTEPSLCRVFFFGFAAKSAWSVDLSVEGRRVRGYGRSKAVLIISMRYRVLIRSRQSFGNRPYVWTRPHPSSCFFETGNRLHLCIRPLMAGAYACRPKLVELAICRLPGGLEGR